MVDPIGTSTVTRRTTQAAAPVQGGVPATVASTEPAADTAAAPELGLQSLARTLATKAPVDDDRVARIRAAIANRTYPILPETIADRLIALKLNWRPE